MLQGSLEPIKHLLMVRNYLLYWILWTLYFVQGIIATHLDQIFQIRFTCSMFLSSTWKIKLYKIIVKIFYNYFQSFCSKQVDESLIANKISIPYKFSIKCYILPWIFRKENPYILSRVVLTNLSQIFRMTFILICNLHYIPWINFLKSLIQLGINCT